jgi:hypothetical protein
MRTNRKPDPKLKDKLLTHITRLKAEIKENEVISELEDNPGWVRIKKAVQRKYDSIDDQLNSFGNMTNDQIRALLKEREIVHYFTSFVDDSVKALAHLQNKLAKAEEERERYKSGDSQL